jgi:ABC-type dipeptide/oligopeptide/nickel transport system permease subunit
VGRFLRNRSAVVGLAIVLALLALALLAPWLTGDPAAQDIDHGLSPRGAPLPPHAGAPLGTDALGRDVWSRLVAGAGLSLTVALGATTLSLVIGVTVGLVAGYAGGVVDAVLMRTVELVLAVPYLLLAILLAAVLRESALGGGAVPATLTLGAVGWTTIARVVRTKVMTLRHLDFVVAARAAGAGPSRILRRHLLPQVIGVVVALAALTIASNLLGEAALSYLGLGAPPPAASWGRMIFDGQAYYRTAPWLIVAPGAAIVLAVIGFHLVGEGLRDALDPRGA